VYRVHEFAERAGVTVKALHHYDRLGLLKPKRTGAGYRVYVDRDLERLEQIVALKFLGLPLKQIKLLLDRDALQLPAALRLQRTVLEEKRHLLDCAIEAIKNAESAIQSGEPADAAVLKKIIEVIEMQTEMRTSAEFMRNYYREESWSQFPKRHKVWPSNAWRDLFRDISGSLAHDPASAKAHKLAARWRELRVSDSGGDPRIHEGLLKAWNDRQYWPESAQSRFSGFDIDKIAAFITGVFRFYRKSHYGDIPPARQLEKFNPEERERSLLSSVGLYFNIAESLGEDPGSERAQALAAQWMELVESRTGSKGPPGKDYEAALQWMQNWPRELHEEIAMLDREKIAEFILRALARPMPSREEAGATPS
jgi:DNA-binding transcriptional MerR regulator